MQDYRPDEGGSRAIGSTSQNDCHHLLRFSTIHNGSTHWSGHATIQHSNLVLFSFRHFAVPEDRMALEACLDSFGMGGIGPAARYLSGLLDTRNAVVSTMNAISLLENLWTRDNPQPFAENHFPIRARILFHTFFQPNDWQIVRELSCVTSSERAAKGIRENIWQSMACALDLIGTSIGVSVSRRAHSRCIHSPERSQ